MNPFSLFTQAPAAQPAAQPATQPATQPASVSANPTVPSASNTPVATATNPDGSVNPHATASPLDKFQDLWKNDPNAPKPAEPFSFNSDPAKLMEAAKTVDFTKVLTPELQKRIQAGGADGQQAVVEAMNLTSQMSFAQAAHASSKITEAALQQMETRFQDMLPTLIKKHSAQDSLRSTNPLMTNPAMAPMIQALQSQFTGKFPQATVTEINQYVNDYLNGAADMITSQRTPATDGKPVKKEEDWGKFFEQAMR